jgi:hypothetical protein
MQRLEASPDASDSGGRRRPGTAIAALGCLAAFLALLSQNGLAPSQQRVSDQALEIVSDLEAALDGGDVGAVMGLLARDWVVLDLPGSVQQVLPVGSQSDELQLYVETVDIDLAACEAEPGSEPVTQLVHCEAAFAGDLPAAIGFRGSAEVVVGVNADRIVSVFQDSDPGLAAGYLDYCIWAEIAHPEMAADAFDITCHPKAEASLHNHLAAAYVAAGRPAPTAEEFESRRSVGIVAAVEASQHEPRNLAEIFSNDWPLVRYPGLLPAELRSPFPAVSEYLAWSDVVYQVELGRCEVGSRLHSGGYRVECPAARWGGALVASLGLEPIAQPVDFFVEDGLITGIVGTTSKVLDGAAAALCQWAQTNRADRAAIAFRADCAPHYTPQGAIEIVALAQDFAGQG